MPKQIAVTPGYGSLPPQSLDDPAFTTTTV
jgi:hypothetical protein